MMNVRKSILSLWKAKKERLSGTRQKPQRRKESPWRNLVRGRKSLSLPQLKETSNPETDFLKEIHEIEFLDPFKTEGQKVRVGSVHIIYANDVVLDVPFPYVNIRTEEFGDVSFFFPDELMERISEYCKGRGIETDRFIRNLIDFGTSVRNIAEMMAKVGTTAEQLTNAMADFSKAVYEAEQKPKLKANNWLKLHGYPMRRKGKGRKKK